MRFWLFIGGMMMSSGFRGAIRGARSLGKVLAPLQRSAGLRASSSSSAGTLHEVGEGISSDSDAHTAALDLYYRLSNCSDPQLGAKINSSLSVLADGLRLYGPHALLSSYNGGKDAVVTMHLLRAAMAKYSLDKGIVYKPQYVYFGMDGEFDEVLEFLREDEERFHLDLSRREGGIAQGLEAHMDSVRASVPGQGTDHFAFVLGTRQGDPNCGGQEKFTPSSPWMPDFMRVNPILDWTYGDVWHFIRQYDLPYCHLYDNGYTSLGKVSDTIPNPALRKKDGIGFWPAYMLPDWSMERAGRGTNISKASGDAGASTDTATVPAAAPATAERQDPALDRAETAALLIIGNEILSGLVADVNVRTAATSLAKAGVDLRRVVVTSDDKAAIASDVAALNQEFDCVITSGGCGPTHDDVTIKAVADALGRKMVLNDEMVTHLEHVFGPHLDRNISTIAHLPENSRLNYPQPLKNDPRNEKMAPWPILQVDNVFILPGVPEIFAKKMATLVAEDMLAVKTAPLILRVIHLAMRETDLMSAIATLKPFADEVGVEVGVYELKDVKNKSVSAQVTLRGRSGEDIDALQAELLRQLETDEAAAKVINIKNA
jgi:FAD synthetase